MVYDLYYSRFLAIMMGSMFNYYINYGIRGVFYIFKNIFYTLFILFCGITIGFISQKIILHEINDYDNYLLLFGISIPVLFFLWLVFRKIHQNRIQHHVIELKIEFLQKLKNKGVISSDVYEIAKEKAKTETDNF